MAHSPPIRNRAPTDNYTEFSLRSPEGTYWEDRNRVWPAHPVQSDLHLDGLLHVEADETGSCRLRPTSAFRARGEAAAETREVCCYRRFPIWKLEIELAETGSQHPFVGELGLVFGDHRRAEAPAECIFHYLIVSAFDAAISWVSSLIDNLKSLLICWSVTIRKALSWNTFRIVSTHLR